MRFTLPSGTPAELARPEESPAQRGLVLVPDVMGLRDLMDDHVRRLSEATGSAVCAFELWPGRQDLSLEERLDAVGTLDDSRVLGDAIAAAEATETESVGILGFCMGGMYAMKAAGSGRFHRAVSFYGMIRVPQRWSSPTQGEPLQALAQPDACPVLAIIGTADPWTPPDDVDALEQTGATVVRYEGADHGFVHDPDRPAHRPDDAADAWRRALEFLRE